MEHEMMMRYMDMIEDLFDLYCGGPVLRNGHKVYPKERIAEQYPNIPEAELDVIVDYLESAEEDCEEIGEELALQYPAVPDDAEVQGYVKECQQKYPWLREDTIKNIFENVCWMSNR